MRRIIGQYVIFDEAVVYADLDWSWQAERVTYDHSGTFARRDKVEQIEQRGIKVNFKNCPPLLWPVGHPDYAAVREWLTGIETPAQDAEMLEIAAGLPSELQAIIKGR